MRKGESLVRANWLRSPNDKYALLMEHTGRIVLYTAQYYWSEIWGIYKYDAENRFVFREDGNMVMYDSRGDISWQSRTKDWDHLDVHDNGYLILSNSNDEPVWVSENFKCKFLILKLLPF